MLVLFFIFIFKFIILHLFDLNEMNSPIEFDQIKSCMYNWLIKNDYNRRYIKETIDKYKRKQKTNMKNNILFAVLPLNLERVGIEHPTYQEET